MRIGENIFNNIRINLLHKLNSKAYLCIKSDVQLLCGFKSVISVTNNDRFIGHTSMHKSWHLEYVRTLTKGKGNLRRKSGLYNRYKNDQYWTLDFSVQVL